MWNVNSFHYSLLLEMLLYSPSLAVIPLKSIDRLTDYAMRSVLYNIRRAMIGRLRKRRMLVAEPILLLVSVVPDGHSAVRSHVLTYLLAHHLTYATLHRLTIIWSLQRTFTCQRQLTIYLKFVDRLMSCASSKHRTTRTLSAFVVYVLVGSRSLIDHAQHGLLVSRHRCFRTTGVWLWSLFQEFIYRRSML